MSEPIHILSLGAGVQSSTLALMAAAGEVTPMPKAAIFADTQAEPASVYKWLDWLENQLSFPVHRVTAGSLKEQIISATQGNQRIDARPPFFLSTGGMLNRQCTQDFKLIPLHRKCREIIGLRPRQRGPKETAIEMWIGISTDEVQRCKPSRHAYISHRWPLIDMRMTRRDCIQWLTRHGYDTPPKSACTFCPYHNDGLWRDMRNNDPTSFAEAVEVDSAIRNGVKDRRSGKALSPAKWFVHRSLTPLSEVDFSIDFERGQLNLFNNECEGMCGV